MATTTHNPMAQGDVPAFPPPTADQPAEPLTIQQIFAQVDTDHSGTIEFEEFAEWWNAKQVQTRGAVDEDALNRIWDLFDRFDADGSKGLVPEEFSRLLAQVAMGEWQEMTDPRTGRVYYAHPHTREAKWVTPSVADFLREQGIVDMSGQGYLEGIDTDGDDDVYMVLNLWKIYLKTAARQRSAHYKDFFVYLIYTVLIGLVVLNNMPLSTSFLMHQEALTDLLLDEEFGVVDNHKKSWYDVMTTEEMWQWTEGPILEAFYEDGALDDNGPQPLLWSNRLIGGIQMRQVRVRPTKCPNTGWAMSDGDQQLEACSGSWVVQREARFTEAPSAIPTKDQCTDAEFLDLVGEADWADILEKADLEDARWDDHERSDCMWWANTDGGEESERWDDASDWYGDWGGTYLAKPETGLSTSSTLVQDFFGNTNANKYGKYGYAVVLPRKGRDFAEQIRQLKGEFVCTLAADGNVTGHYHDESTEAERGGEDGTGGCFEEGDCPNGKAACLGCAAGDDPCISAHAWEQNYEFVDEYTRMFAVSFNLYNGNDFDIDDYDPNDATDGGWVGTDHLDDHLALCQMSFAFHPSGHMEKYERVSIVRPMRTVAYLDSTLNQIGAVAMLVLAGYLFLNELKTIKKNGIVSYFIKSENNIWNCFEIIFFGMLVWFTWKTVSFYEQCEVQEARLIKARDEGRLDHEYIDIFDLKSDFRAMLRSVSFLVFMTLLKLFKYMSFSDNLSFMFKVITRAKTELGGFMIVYLLLIGCFAFLASTLFGYEMREFHNFASALMSLVRLSVGLLDFDYNVMKEAEGFWSPLFLAIFVFVAMLTVVNLFISILSEYYDQVKTETNQWNEDIKIFEMQGMTVPSSSVLGNIGALWDQLNLNFTLMVEVDPPHLPVEVLPVSKLVGPTWGEGDQKDVTCYPNVFDNASNLIRLHYFSEFVPVELENTRGRGRANIPILGQISEKKGLHAHCVGLGKTESPINELIAEFGKLWAEDNWECSHCQHRYNPELNGHGKSIEEVHDDLAAKAAENGSADRPKWPCPNCRQTDPMKTVSASQRRPIFDHVDTMSSFRRLPVKTQTVACLKLHPDDMHSEVRPQVLSKMRARYKTMPNPETNPMEDPDGDMDVDFNNLANAEPDTLDLMEDEFGAKIQLECLLHEEMQEEVKSNGQLIGKARDSFALFRVVQISSHEHYGGEPTKLNKAEGMWKKVHDRLVYENDNPGKQRAGQQVRTNSQMAEMFGKSEREVELRRRFLKRLHRDDEGYPVTPKQLRIKFQPPLKSVLRMWSLSLKDETMKAVSCNYAFSLCKKGFRCARYSDPHHRDMKQFIRKQIQYIKDGSNVKDLTELEENFLKQNMSLADAVTRMKVHLVNTDRRNPKRMAELYGGRVGAKHIVDAKVMNKEGKQVVAKMPVEEKLKRWLMTKYADEIDCVIIKNEDEDQEEVYHDDGGYDGHAQQQGGSQEGSRLQQLKERRRTVGGQ